MTDLSIILTKEERLLRLEVDQHFEIKKDRERLWRNQIVKTHKGEGKGRKFSVRTSEDNITRVIRLK